MSCCGRQRSQASLLPRNASEGERRPAGATPAGLVMFEYVGATALTATGPVTGKTYRFDRPRARVAVDGLDAAGMAAVPSLRRV